MPILGSQTKTVNDAIVRAQNDLKGVSIGATDALDFSNEIYQIMGTATWWDWLIKTTGSPFGTVAHQQDYAVVPTDFRRLKDAWINDDSSTFTPMMPMAVRETLSKSNTRGLPRAISQENTNFRLFPVPLMTRTVTGQWAIYYEYWSIPKRLTSLGDLFEFGDQYFEVYAAGVTARVASFVRFENAGEWFGRDPQNNQFRGTGLWGKFAGLLNNAVREEELSSGSVIQAPQEDILRW